MPINAAVGAFLLMMMSRRPLEASFTRAAVLRVSSVADTRSSESIDTMSPTLACRYAFEYALPYKVRYVCDGSIGGGASEREESRDGGCDDR